MQDIDKKLLILFKKIDLKNQPLDKNGEIGNKFFQKGITDLYAAINFVSRLKYQHPSDPYNWNLVIPEQCGTCSTRHALLVLLAKENNIPFALGHAIYNLTPEGFPQIKAVLAKAGLPNIPETHKFIVYNNYFLDITFPDDPKILSKNDVTSMETIDCSELLSVRKGWYLQFLKKWLAEHSNMTLVQYDVLHSEIIQLLKNVGPYDSHIPNGI